MTQVNKLKILTPKQAARKKSAVDALLDVSFFKALSDPTRVQLLCCLLKCNRPCSVSEVAECCSVDFSVVARHLTLLAREGILQGKKDGRTVWYSVEAAQLESKFKTLAEAIASCCTTAGCCGTEGCE